MIKWLIDNWVCISIFIGVIFIYFFVFMMHSVSHEADEQVENDATIMRKTSASERYKAKDPANRGKDFSNWANCQKMHFYNVLEQLTGAHDLEDKFLKDKDGKYGA